MKNQLSFLQNTERRLTIAGTRTSLYDLIDVVALVNFDGVGGFVDEKRYNSLLYIKNI